MKLTSASFLSDQPIPEQFAFGAPDPVLHVRLAANHNPQLKWSGAPADTRSFAADLRRQRRADQAGRRQQGRPPGAGEPAARQVLSLGDGRHSGSGERDRRG